MIGGHIAPGDLNYSQEKKSRKNKCLIRRGTKKRLINHQSKKKK